MKANRQSTIIRSGLSRLLVKDADFEIAALAEDGEQALELAVEHLSDRWARGNPVFSRHPRRGQRRAKQIILRSHSITKENADSYERRLDRATRPIDRTICVGYAQVGTESGWRPANNRSTRDAAREFGVGLTAIDADSDQQAQLKAVREFIRQTMDVIVISPIVDSGWDDVLMEAREADIPALLSDRKISVAKDDLFMTFVGADFIEEGRRAMRWTVANVPADRHPVRILEIQGTEGATPTIERKRGFEMLLAEHPDYEIVYSEGGDFTRKGGRAVIRHYLREHAWDIDVIYSHSGGMAPGAVKALEEGGLNCVVGCSPLLGPQLMKAVTDYMSGKELPLRIITDERVFIAETRQEELRDRKYGRKKGPAAGWPPGPFTVFNSAAARRRSRSRCRGRRKRRACPACRRRGRSGSRRLQRCRRRGR